MSADIIELLHTTPAPHMTVDPVRAMADGRRARVRRRLVLSAAAAAAVAAVGAAQVATHDGALPARPTSTTTLTAHPMNTGPTPFREVRVEYFAAERKAHFILVPTSGGAARGADVRLAPDLDGGFTVLDPGSDQPTLLAIGPSGPGVDVHPATVLQPDRDRGWYAMGDPLPGTGLGTLVRSLSKGEDEGLALYWSDPVRGAIFTDGSRVDVAKVAVGTFQIPVWVNRTHQVGPLGQSTDPGFLDAQIASGTLAAQGSGSGRDAAGKPYTEADAVGLLPPGATRVTPLFHGARPTGLDFGTAPLSGEGVVAVVMRRMMPQADADDATMWAGVRGVSWFDASGAPHETPLLR